MNTSDPSPPKSALKFFRWYCHPSLLPAIEGDLMELYSERVRLSGKRKADLNFIADVFLLLRPAIIRPAEGHQSLNQFGMFKSYVKIGWRNLIKSKGYSSINIGGLAIGMAAAILIGLWLHSELTFNQNFSGYDRITRVIQNQEFNGVTETWYSQSKLIGPELRDYYGSNFKYVVQSSWPDTRKITYNGNSIRRSGNAMDPDAAHMLDLNMVKGTRAGLKDLNSVLLSEGVAKAIFGDEDPMDKSLRIDDKVDVKVAGVYKDLPDNCDFTNVGFIFPFDLFIKDMMPEWIGWGNSWFQCFAQLAPGVDIETANASIRDSKLKRVANASDARFKPVILLHPMSKWHLYYYFENGVAVGGGIRNVWMFGTIGMFVLLLASINFMNLSTARAERRAKEVGIRKTVGSRHGQLVNQFYVESFIVVGLALIIAAGLAQSAMPWFNSVSGKNLNVPWTNPVFWAVIIGFTAFVGSVSGSYPAFYLSSFNPVKALKGRLKAGRQSSISRKVMVVVQFSISIVLIVSTFVIVSQIDYAQNRPLGYTSNGIMVTPIRSDDVRNHYDAVANDLKATGVVVETAYTDVQITDTGTTNSGFFWKGKPDDMQDAFWTLRLTPDFGKLMNWTVIEGRDFVPGDTSAFIINETAAKYMGLTDPVGEIVRWGENGEYKIIGVVKDMVMQSAYGPVKQMIFALPSDPRWMQRVNMKLHPEANIEDATSKIEAVFKKHDPNNPFEYSFADQKISERFTNEKRIASLSSGLAFLAIFICCLGLLGLASHMAEQRTKEIGIRKVMGASIGGLWRMMSKDFMMLVIVAGVIAMPAAYYLAYDWLSQFEYRVPLSWFIFVAAIGGALLIALLTVSYHALRSAMANPINSLRSE